MQVNKYVVYLHQIEKHFLVVVCWMGGNSNSLPCNYDYSTQLYIEEKLFLQSKIELVSLDILMSAWEAVTICLWDHLQQISFYYRTESKVMSTLILNWTFYFSNTTLAVWSYDMIVLEIFWFFLEEDPTENNTAHVNRDSHHKAESCNLAIVHCYGKQCCF